MSQTPEDPTSGLTAIPFSQVLEALLDEDKTFQPRYLHRFSDLTPEELEQLQDVWPRTPLWRRKAVLEDIELLSGNDTILSFESMASYVTQDPEPEIRTMAVRALYEYESPELARLFLGLVQKDASPEVRAVAASGLGQYVYLGELEEISESLLHSIEDTLLGLLQDTTQETLLRRRALEAIGFSSRDEVNGWIDRAYTSGDKDWMTSALFAMGRSANADWKPQVLASLSSKLPSLRAEAARAAGELELRSASPRILELLDDPDDGVRAAAIWAVSQLGGKGVRERLERMFKRTEDEEEAELIEDALDNLAFTEDTLPLMPLLDLPEGEDGDDEDEEFYAALERDLEEEYESEDDDGLPGEFSEDDELEGEDLD